MAHLLVILASTLLAHALPPVAKIDQQSFYVFGDMLIDIAPDEGSDILQGARPGRSHIWDDGVIPIEFHKDIPEGIRSAVMEACRTWAQYGDIQCIRGKYKKKSLFVTRDGLAGVGGGCFSTLGQSPYYLGIARRMNLDPNCWDRAIILHEMGHALGLTHEHQREDRDDYVQIKKRNLQPDYSGLIYKLNFAEQKTELFTPYDFLSIMHYSWNAGAGRRDIATIVPKPGYEKYRCVMGYVTELSEGDKQSIAQLYGKAINPPVIPEDGKKMVQLPNPVDFERLRNYCRKIH